MALVCFSNFLAKSTVRPHPNFYGRRVLRSLPPTFMPFFVALFPCAQICSSSTWEGWPPSRFLVYFACSVLCRPPSCHFLLHYFLAQKICRPPSCRFFYCSTVKTFLNRAYASTMALFCFSNFLAKSTVRPHPNFYGRRVLRSLPPTFMPFFVALFPCAQICSSSTWERWPPSRFLVYFACSVLCRPPSCHFLLHYFLAQKSAAHLRAVFSIVRRSKPFTRACLNFITLTFRALGRNHIASTPVAGIGSVLCRPPSCHFLLHYFLAHKSAPRPPGRAGHHHVFWFTLPAPFFAAHLHAIFCCTISLRKICRPPSCRFGWPPSRFLVYFACSVLCRPPSCHFLLHYFLAQKNCRTPAVYPRLFEFHHFDIQSTGQKSHCVNTGCGYRLRSLPPTFMPFFVALFPCAQICSSSTWEGWPPSRFLVYFACSVLCRPPSCHFLLHSKQTTGHH